MLIIRKFGRLLRGKATPFQIIGGSLLGACLGFMPNFADAPGLIVVLTFALLVLNANLFLAATIGLVAKLLSLALMPVSFALGRFFLDGPTESLFRQLINAPVFALFGFESYVVTGGLALGVVLGLGGGGLLALAVTSFRQKMAGLDQNSPRMHTLLQSPWARCGTFLLAGSGLKKPDYAALLAQSKVGNPIRVLGVVVVVLSLLLTTIAYQFVASSILTAQLRSGLAQANGATVDLDRAEVDLRAGRVTLTGLAISDPNALGTDLFRAAKIEADLSGRDLLRKRLRLDRVVVLSASSGEARRVPGRRTAPTQAAPEAKAPGDSQSLDDYLQNAQVWRERLSQVQQWLEQLSGPDSTAGTTTEPKAETWEARLRRLAAQHGYASVKATHLIAGAPTFTVTELLAGDIKVARLPDELLQLTARHLSTQPALLANAPELHLTSASDRLQFHATLAGLGAAPGANQLAFHYRNLAVDDVMQRIKTSGGAVLKGGTIDLVGRGEYFLTGGRIEFPLEATLRNTSVNVGGRATNLSQFVLPITLSGSLSNP
ncbi:MAG: hypothetical protein Q8M02_07420, partial [Candidatus Didemnitutus sp.]|nr:hypothetical protein [Candidatus Didemnitutus sp.]